ncbi:MAG: hypothetical protein K5765_04565 [Clostridia bacterium]|nr:hypothetical protein [Clostridia bacterium]
MNNYIIFANAFGVGGWQIYAEGRVIHLLNKGFRVYVLSPYINKGIIKLPFLNKTSVLPINELFRNPLIYNQHQRNVIISKVLSFIKYNEKDEYFFESTSINSSMWGEMIAKKVKGKNFSYLLHSHIENVSKDVHEFFNFKYYQRLLAGMTPNTIKELLFRNIDVNSDLLYSFKADGRDPLSNENLFVDEINKIIEFKKENKRIIGYFGNLDKPHVIELTNRIIKYCATHIDCGFVFVTVGSSNKGKVEKQITKLVKKCSNLDEINIPEAYPVPIFLFENMDVCIGSWGSARTAARTGVLTIRLMGDIDVVPQGIIGVTLRNDIYYDLPVGTCTLNEYLDNILFLHTYDSIENNSKRDYNDYEIIQNKIDFFIDLSNSRVDNYYDVLSIKSISKKEKIMKLLCSSLGLKISDLLFRFFNKR